MSIWRFAEQFSSTKPAHRISLGEGQTPLVRSRRIGPQVGLDALYFKLESTNPSGSYKDRFAAAAISDMLERGKTHSVGTSSGNTGSAIAAYCAVAGITCQIAVLEDTPQGKLKQMLAYGARIYKVRGMGTDPTLSRRLFDRLERLASRPEAQLQISAFAFSPAGMSGVQTISYELDEQLESDSDGSPIDHVFAPAGGGGLTLAVARGFAGLVQGGRLEVSPAIHCVQPEGNDTMAGPLVQGADRARSRTCTSQISGLQVGNVIDGDQVIEACRASGGTGHLVSDQTAWDLQQRMAREEGIFCEPAGVVALAGALGALDRGQIKRGDRVVCLVTGIGFKDMVSVDRLIAGAQCPLIDVEDLDHI